jgi:hypothetical protein
MLLGNLVLLVIAACNVGWFHGSQSLERLDFVARALMLLSTVIWIAVLTGGRWIACLCFIFELYL